MHLSISIIPSNKVILIKLNLLEIQTWSRIEPISLTAISHFNYYTGMFLSLYQATIESYSYIVDSF